MCVFLSSLYGARPHYFGSRFTQVLCRLRTQLDSMISYASYRIFVALSLYGVEHLFRAPSALRPEVLNKLACTVVSVWSSTFLLSFVFRCACLGRLCMDLDLITLVTTSHMMLVVCGRSSTIRCPRHLIVCLLRRLCTEVDDCI